jgi:ankyrin repeat protein
LKVKEMTDRVFSLIEANDRLSLERFLLTSLTVPLTDLADHRGYSALHLAAFKGFADIAKTLLEFARDNIIETEMKTWVNQKTNDDGFTALHFSSFRGNIPLIELLLAAGSDM